MDFIIDTVGDNELQIKTELLDDSDKCFIAMEPRLRASSDQFIAIIEFMERYGDLSRPPNGVQGRLRSERLWQKLTIILNTTHGGVKKSTLKWKKVWADWKAKTKKKYLALKQFRSSITTGNRQYLNVLEARVAAMLEVNTSARSSQNQEQQNTLPQPIGEVPDDEGEVLVFAVPHDSDKEDRTQAILSLFNKKKEELDAIESAEEELQKKLNNLKIDSLFDDFFADMTWTNSSIIHKNKKKRRRLFHFDQLDLETGKLKSNLGGVDVEKEMLKSVLKPGIEKEHVLPNYNISEKKLRALRKKERQMTKGPGWFDMKAPEVTEELKNDLNVLKMRSVLDPKHFYKKNDMEVLPKFFQVGTIMDSALDHVNERLTKKERKRTMVDELLADAEFQKYNKKKYKEIIDDKRKTEYRTFMKDKRQKNKAALKSNKIKPKKSVK